MKPGDKVVCVVDFAPLLRPCDVGCKAPVVNEVYTVRDIEITSLCTTIQLVELINPKNEYYEGNTEIYFDIDGFRPVDYTYGKEVCEKLEKELSETLIPESV